MSAIVSSMANQHATLSEIAEILGNTKRTAERKASAWDYEIKVVRGGKQRLYPLSSLPDDIQQAIRLSRLNRAADCWQTPDAAPAEATLPAAALPAPMAANQPIVIDQSASLTTDQLNCERARDRLLNYVSDYPGSVARALDALNADRQAGRLPAPLKWAYENAWDKPRSDNRLTMRTYFYWQSLKSERGRSAPKKIGKDLTIKPWYGLLLSLRQRPQGSCLNWIAEQIKENWDANWSGTPPSYHTIRRVCRDKLSRIDQLKGRFTGSQLRSHQHWQPRSAAGMYPWQEVHADGWATHFTAPHPQSGEYVTYEVWHYHDVATRYVTPPGIGLSETYEVVTAGLERCVRHGGMMAVLQTDSTKVIKGSPKFTADPLLALSERAGFMHVTPVAVGNSQANGLCENFNRWLDQQSRELATYQATGMDSLTLKRVKKITAKMVKENDPQEREKLVIAAEKTGKGIVFTSFQSAIDWINATCEKWNDKPHRSLPKITDASTGKIRHQTPREALMRQTQAGWRPVALTEDQLVDLFRPHVRCRVMREAVSPIGNGQRYRFSGLGDWNGQDVMVAIDPMDWQKVWVKTLEGEAIGVAELVEATGYRAKAQYEIAEEKRAAAQLRRNSQKGEQILARRGQPLAVEESDTVIIGGRVLSTKNTLQETEKLTITVQESAPVSRSQRPPAENFAEWKDIDRRIAAGEAISEEQARWHRSYPQSAQFRVENSKLSEQDGKKRQAVA